MNQPLVEIPDEQVRAELKLPWDQERFSYAELKQHRPLLSLINKLFRKEKGEGFDPLESKVNDITNILQLLQQVFRNEVIKPVPDPKEAAGAWQPIVPPVGGHPSQYPEVAEAWSDLKRAFLADNNEAFVTASKKLEQALDGIAFQSIKSVPHCLADHACRCCVGRFGSSVQ